MKNLVLTGMMGSGKSTMAGLLGESLCRPVVDTDDLVEKMAGMTITELFSVYGEPHMRDLETAVCRELSQKENLVIACGGGLPLREENRRCLREKGIVIFLNRNPEEIYDTIDTSGRPLAQQGKGDFLRRFAQRESIYREFSHIEILDFSSPEATRTEILKKLEGFL